MGLAVDECVQEFEKFVKFNIKILICRIFPGDTEKLEVGEDKKFSS